MADFSAWACWATGAHRYATWTRPTRPTRSALSWRVLERGFVYRGLKPVYWCFDCGQLAGRVRDRVQPTRRARPSTSVPLRRARARLASAFGPPSLGESPVRHRHLDHHRVDHPPTRRSTATRLGLRAGRHRARPAGAGGGAGGEVVPGALRPLRARCQPPPAEARRHPLPHPLQVDPFYDRSQPVYLADYATAEGRHRHRALAPRPTASTTSTPASQYGAEVRRHPQPGAGQRPLRGRPCRCSAARTSGRPCRSSSRRCRRRPPARHRDHHAQLPALLAPQDAGDLPRGGAMVRAHGRGRGVFTEGQGAQNLRQMALDAIDPPASIPERPRRPARHDRQPARLVHLRQRSWGVPPFFLHKDSGELHPRTWRSRPGGRHRGARRHRGLGRATAEEIFGAADAPHYTKSSDILEVWFDSAPPSPPCCVAPDQHPGGTTTRRPEADLYLEGRPAPRLVPQLAAAGLRAAWDRVPLPRPAGHGFTVDSQGRKDEQVAGQRHRRRR